MIARPTDVEYRYRVLVDVIVLDGCGITQDALIAMQNREFKTLQGAQAYADKQKRPSVVQTGRLIWLTDEEMDEEVRRLHAGERPRL